MRKTIKIRLNAKDKMRMKTKNKISLSIVSTMMMKKSNRRRKKMENRRVEDKVNKTRSKSKQNKKAMMTITMKSLSDCCIEFSLLEATFSPIQHTRLVTFSPTQHIRLVRHRPDRSQGHWPTKPFQSENELASMILAIAL